MNDVIKRIGKMIYGQKVLPEKSNKYWIYTWSFKQYKLKTKQIVKHQTTKRKTIQL